MSTVFFHERQFFRQWYVWVILIGVDLIFLWGLIQQLIIGKPFGNNPMSDLALVFVSLFVFLLSLFMGTIHLNTEITEEEIRIIFFPISRRTILWSQVAEANIRQYKALSEFGGWGLRFGRHGPAYNISGNIGLELVLTDGKKVLIGTQRSEELKLVLKNLGK